MTTDKDAEIRRKILDYFYDVYRGTETSDRGRVPCTLAVNALCKRIGGDRAAVTEILARLVQTDHVKYLDVPTALGHYATYTIGPRGIHLIEAELSLSVDRRASDDSAEYVTIDANLVATLAELRRLIESDARLNPVLRSDAVRDVDAITAQMRETRPDVGIIKGAWEGIKIAALTSSEPSLFAKCALLLSVELRNRLR